MTTGKHCKITIFESILLIKSEKCFFVRETKAEEEHMRIREYTYYKIVLKEYTLC